MAIFSRKTKADQQKVAVEAAAPKPTKAPFRPRHARSSSTSASAVPRAVDMAAYPGSLTALPIDPHAVRAAPVPPVPRASRASFGRTESAEYSRDGDYFSRRDMSLSTHESAAAAAASRDHGYHPAHSDSGYESTGSFSALHSRAPSEKLVDEFKLPALTLTNGTTLGLAGEEAGAFDRLAPADRKSRSRHVHDDDHEVDARSLKSTRSAVSVRKRTRFEEHDRHPMPGLDVLHVHQQRSTSAPLPPLAILDGFRVNKRGLVLDEEGDPIGELCDGDILDCVRQKVNGRGEVLDEYGRVVGAVRTLPFATAAPVLDLPPLRHTEVTPPMLSPYVASVEAVQQLEPPADTSSQLQTSAPVLSVDTTAAAAPIHLPYEHEEQRLPSTEDISLVTEPKQEQVHTQQPENVTTIASGSTARDFGVVTAAVAAVTAADQPKRPTRSASERSLSELSKPYARPAMSSVPEDNVAEDLIMPTAGDAFAFKGEIPVDDRLQREARSRSPHLAINPKAALALGQPNSAMLRMPPNPRRATTHFAGSGSHGGASIQGLAPGKHPMNFPLRPSPLSSHENSPGRSDSGADSYSDDGRYPSGSRAASFVGSVPAAPMAKPRTYFTHSGRITIDPNAPRPAKQSEQQQKPVAAAAPAEKEKKKSRMSLSLMRRKTAA